MCGRIKFLFASSSPSAFSSRPGYSSWAYLRNGRIRGVPREVFSELISMNEVEQFIFGPALEARWCQGWRAKVWLSVRTLLHHHMNRTRDTCLNKTLNGTAAGGGRSKPVWRPERKVVSSKARWRPWSSAQYADIILRLFLPFLGSSSCLTVMCKVAARKGHKTYFRRRTLTVKANAHYS